MAERMRNGVKSRFDGGGDKWANEHRVRLWRDDYMQDIDAIFGMEIFGKNTADRLFAEYVPLGHEDHNRLQRRFGLVALFDRKISEFAAFHKGSKMSLDLYLWLCRIIGSTQSIDPKFFYVCGNNEMPWTMIEIDIHTGNRTGEPHVITCEQEWRRVWSALGIREIRRRVSELAQKSIAS